jgi:hypothetical protein
MQIVYCDTCGLRIPDKEFEAGRAVKSDGRNYCEKCVPKAAAPAAPVAPPNLLKPPSKPQLHNVEALHSTARISATGLSPARREAHASDAHARESRQAAPPKKGIPVLAVALGVGALILVGIGVFTFGGDNAPKPGSGNTRDDRVAAVVPNTRAPTKPATEPRREENRRAESDSTEAAPVKQGPNPEKLAEDALNDVMKFSGLAADDRSGRIKRLEEYLAIHGNTMVATHAWQDLKKMKSEAAAESDKGPPIPPSVIVGGVPDDDNPRGAAAGQGGAVAPTLTVAVPNNSDAAISKKESAGKSAVDDQPDAAKKPAPPPAPAAAEGGAPSAKVALAQAGRDAVRKEIQPLLQQQHFSAALDVVERKLKDPALAEAQELLLAERSDLTAVLELRDSAVDAVRGMAGKTISLKRGKSALSGSATVDPSRPGITLKTSSGLEMAFAPEQFQAQDIDAYAPRAQGREKADDLRARALLFLDINEIGKAREYMKSAQDAGASVTALAERIAALENDELENRAKLDWTAAETAFSLKRWDAAQKAYLNFQTAHAKTKTFAALANQAKDRLQTLEVTLHPYQEGLCGSFFRNREFAAGDHLLDRIDTKIDFNWNNDAPGPNLPRDNFCARWTGMIRVTQPGHYIFTTIADDNARLWIDGKQLVNDWGSDHGPKPVSGAVELSEGFHEVKLEYAQGGGGAVMRFMWHHEGSTEMPVPAEALWHRTQKQNEKGNEK